MHFARAQNRALVRANSVLLAGTTAWGKLGQARDVRVSCIQQLNFLWSYFWASEKRAGFHRLPKSLKYFEKDLKVTSFDVFCALVGYQPETLGITIYFPNDSFRNIPVF